MENHRHHFEHFLQISHLNMHPEVLKATLACFALGTLILVAFLIMPFYGEQVAASYAKIADMELLRHLNSIP